MIIYSRCFFSLYITKSNLCRLILNWWWVWFPWRCPYKSSKLNYHTKGNSNKHALNYLTYQIVYNGNLLWPSGKLSNVLRVYLVSKDGIWYLELTNNFNRIGVWYLFTLKYKYPLELGQNCFEYK